MTTIAAQAEELRPCPFCGERPYPITDILRDQKKLGRHLECKCNVFLYRSQCWVDDAHTRLETDKELDANLTKRWNTRAAPPEGMQQSIRHYLDKLKYRPTGADPKNDGYTYAEVPEWQLRRWLAAAEAPQEGRGEIVNKP